LPNAAKPPNVRHGSKKSPKSIPDDPIQAASSPQEPHDIKTFHIFCPARRSKEGQCRPFVG
jgi:hypothetical protein